MHGVRESQREKGLIVAAPVPSVAVVQESHRGFCVVRHRDDRAMSEVPLGTWLELRGMGGKIERREYALV